MAGYTVFDIDLSAAGSQLIEQQGDVLYVVQVLDGTALALDVAINVEPEGRNSFGNAIPLRIGNHARTSSQRFRLTWDANPGHTAKVAVSSGLNPVDLDTKPPIQLLAGASGGSLAVAKVSVSTSSTAIAAASVTRKSLIIQNYSGSTVFLNQATATTDGFPLSNGQALTLDKTTAAVYGICAAGSADIRTLEES